MSIKIKPLRKFTTGTPSTSDMVEGELAVNTADKKVFMRDNANNIVEVGASSELFTSGAATNIDVNGRVTADEFKFKDSNTLLVSTVYTGNSSGSYFTTNEIQEILSITPNGDSENYTILGQITLSSGSAGAAQTLNIHVSVRSNTLPDLAFTQTYNEELTVSNDTYITPILFTKETTTASVKLCFKVTKQIFGVVSANLVIIPRIASDLTNVSVNTTVASEFTGTPTGFTERSFIRTYVVNAGNYELQSANATKIQATSTGATVTGTLVSDSLTINTNELVTDADGRVGIGTSSPQQLLHVSYSDTNTNLTNKAGGNTPELTSGLRVNNTSTTTDTYASIDLRANNADVRLASVNKGSNTSNFVVLMDGVGNGDLDEALRITSTGNMDLTSTSDGGPLLSLISNDHADAANFGQEGSIRFVADNDADQSTEFARIYLATGDVTDGTEDGWMYFQNIYNGTIYNNFAMGSSGSFYLLSNGVNNPVVEWNQTGGTTFDVQLGTANPTDDRTITLPDATGTVITTGNSNTPTTTTSSGDADFVLIDDGGTMKKITPSNLGVGSVAADDISTGDAAVTIGTSSGNITLDTDGDIILDANNAAADGGGIFFKDNGQTFGHFVSNDFYNASFLTTDLELRNTGTGPAAGPLFKLYRNSNSPAANDDIGQIQFNAEDSAGNAHGYVAISGKILSTTNGSEKGTITAILANGDAGYDTITLPNATGTVHTTANPEISGTYGSSSSPRIFEVTVATQTAAHPYNGDGSANKYSIDGIQGAALTLHGADATTSNSEYYYRFDQSDSSNSGHPLLFYLDAAKNTQHTTGVTTNGTPGSAGAYTQIAITSSTPKVLYYQCSQHGYMGNYVTVATAGGSGSGSSAADDITTGDAEVTIATSSGSITIDNQADDQDIIFKGTDDGSDITALRLDMSDAGKAIFSGQASFGKELLVDMPHVGTYTKPAQFLVNDMGSNDRAQFTFGKALSTSNLVEFGYKHVSDGSASNVVSIGFWGSSLRTVQNPAGQVAFGYGDASPTFNERININGNIWLDGSIVFEGSSADAYETTLSVANPTGSDKTITLPNATGTVLTTGNSNAPTTTTSSGDADFVLIDDGGTMKKITPANLGVGGGGGGGSSAADDITTGDAAVTLATSSGNITVDAQENNSEIIFKGTIANNDIEYARFTNFSSGAFFELNNGTRIRMENSNRTKFNTLQFDNPTSDSTIIIPNISGTLIHSGNANFPTTTTSSADADFVLVSDGGVMKKITPTNLGIGGGGGGSGVTVQDEGSSLSTTGTVLNFVGAGVTASGTGIAKTITIPAATGVSEAQAIAFAVALG